MPLSSPTRVAAREAQQAQARLDRVFHALGDRTRRAMVERLTKGPASISELAAPFDMSLPGASKHVRVLEEAGLLTRSTDGRTQVCGLQPERLDEAQAWVAAQREFWAGALDALAHYASSQRDGGRRRR